MSTRLIRPCDLLESCVFFSRDRS